MVSGLHILLTCTTLFCLAIGDGVAGMDYTCTPGASPSPGVSLPRGDIFLEASSPLPTQTIYCLLNPSHEYFTNRGIRSSHLSFSTPSGRVVQSTIVNETAIVAHFTPTGAGEEQIQCIATTPSYNKLGICNQKIFTGYLPEPVEDFSCISHNWHNLNCTWNKPYNPIDTQYSLVFREPGKYSFFKSCPNASELELHLGYPVPVDSCYIDLTTHPPYRQPIKTYTFQFNGTNRLAPTGFSQIIQIDHYSVMKPDPPNDLRVKSVSPSKLLLTYSIPTELTHFHPGLDHSIKVRNEWNNSWVDLDTSRFNQSVTNLSLPVENLEFPYTNYFFQVKMISGSADKQNLELWSDVAEVFEKTNATRPFRSPLTINGSFEVIEQFNDQRTVLIYWGVMRPQEHNGPQFKYNVRGPDLTPVSVRRSYARFEKVPNLSTMINVTAENSVGLAPFPSIVTVPAELDMKDLEPRSLTKIYKESDRFEIAWRPPVRNGEIVSYTLFWCKAEDYKDRPYQCDGELEWKIISPQGDELIMSHDLLLPTASVYQVAVSANTIDASSGMVWASCTVIKGRLISVVNQVKVQQATTNSLWVRWKLDCSDQADFVFGYRVEYCDSVVCRTEDTSPDKGTLLLQNLSPYTVYKIGVIIQNREKFGKVGKMVEGKTLSAPPDSPPRQFTISSITSDSALVSWEIPEIPNGVIYKYRVKVFYSNYNGSKVFVNSQDVNTTEVTLSQLLSYTWYSVLVAGCTIVSGSSHRDGCSEYNAEARFQTDVGTPERTPPPIIEFHTSVLVKISWTRGFQIGAPQPEKWQLEVRRSGVLWADVPPFYVNFTGELTHSNISLNLINDKKGWSPDCENETNTNTFDFSLRVIVQDKKTGVEYVGPWSERKTVPAYCKHAISWTLIIVVVSVVSILVVVAIVLFYRAGLWWYLKKDFFNELGKELDSKFVLASHDNLDGDGTMGVDVRSGPEYELSHFSGPNGGDDGKEDPGDTDTLLLKGRGAVDKKSQRNKSGSESAQSDLTSGCESQERSCNTDLISECSTRSHLPPISDHESSGSGYVSMSRADSGGSNYTQISLSIPKSRPNSLAGTLPRPTGPSASSEGPKRSSLEQINDTSSPTTPSTPTASTMPPVVSPSAEDGRASICISSNIADPGYSQVRNPGHLQSSPGYIPLHVNSRRNDSQGGSGYISVEQAQELVLQPNPTSQQYCRVVPRVEILKAQETSTQSSPPAYVSPSYV